MGEEVTAKVKAHDTCDESAAGQGAQGGHLKMRGTLWHTSTVRHAYGVKTLDDSAVLRSTSTRSASRCENNLLNQAHTHT